MKASKRQIAREAQKRIRTRNRILTYVGISLGALALAAVIFLAVNAPSASAALMGDEVPILSRDHIPTDSVPGPYNSNPPAGGAHYPIDFTEHFYQESELASLPAHPEGYLVHSLEHGYVIFWYNCQAANTNCDSLKQTIQSVMDQTGGKKMIAFPWTSMDVPLAMTSWGRIMKFQTPDAAVMKKLVESNRYKAPEPDAP
ncbi:MAG TPA: DUF3105 domain-containing protein [Anaerolinea sp.]|nr:DUF3105 domain-containing protein [Anaerolinea sp.]